MVSLAHPTPRRGGAAAEQVSDEDVDFIIAQCDASANGAIDKVGRGEDVAHIRISSLRNDNPFHGRSRMLAVGQSELLPALATWKILADRHLEEQKACCSCVVS
jgi:hypothetical protein